MHTHRGVFSPRSSSDEFTRQWEVEEIVLRAIAMRGYYSVIVELLIALHDLAETVLAAPQNQLMEREFKIWTRTVQIVIRRHSAECTFENRIDESDAFWAKGMGIRLD